jgi:Domain of Unknown Function (DUF1080)
MSTIRNQPSRDNPGRFLVVDAGLEALPGSDLGLLWHSEPTPADFILRLEWRRWTDNDNSGVFLRFPDPDSKGCNNTAFVAADFGFEVQIDQLARNDGAGVHKTAAIYGVAGPTNPNNLPVNHQASGASSRSPSRDTATTWSCTGPTSPTTPTPTQTEACRAPPSSPVTSGSKPTQAG